MNATKPSTKSDLDLTTDPQAQREADRAQANRDELTERIALAIRHDGTIEPLKGLHFNRISASAKPCHSVSVPAFCAIAQGSKEILLGRDIYQYDPSQRQFGARQSSPRSAGSGQAGDLQNSGRVVIC